MDVKLIQDSVTTEIDISIVNDEFVLDDGLETSVLISLHSDAREDSRTDDPRGWWGTSVQTEDISGALFGSKFWLMHREKQTQEMLNTIEEWCLNALQWMIDEGIATSVEVAVSYPEIGLVAIEVEILRGDLNPISFKYQTLWNGQYGI